MTDLSYSWRRLRTAPGFAFLATLTLSLGIGANVALFSMINGLLFKSVAIPNIESIVSVVIEDPSTGQISTSVYQDSVVGLSDSSLFKSVVIRDFLTTAVSSGDRAKQVSGELVSGNYFQVLGVSPQAGRLLQASDDSDAAATPVVISKRLSHEWFASDQDALGQTLRLSGHPAVIVGVAPRAFKGSWIPMLLEADIWLPVRTSDLVKARPKAGFPLRRRVLASLASGVSLSQADAAVGTLRAGQPDDAGPRWRLRVMPGRAGVVPAEFDKYGHLVGGIATLLAGLTFLIACANLANMLLARGVYRAGELAVRTALGASPRRILRLILTETALIAAIAAIAGSGLSLLVTAWLTSIQLPQFGGFFTLAVDATPDSRVAAYAFVVAALAMCASGIIPARRAASSQTSFLIALGGSGATTAGYRGLRTQLVTLQISLSVLLLIVAGLFLKSSVATFQADPGYDLNNLVVASLRLDENIHRQPTTC